MSEANSVEIVNYINLAVSIGLLGLGIVLIIYGFKIPDKKCEGTTTDDCLIATDGKTDIHDTVETMRLVGLITGFILIIPFGLNLLEFGLKLFPGTGSITSATEAVGSSINQSSYRMKNHGGYNMGGGYGFSMNKRY